MIKNFKDFINEKWVGTASISFGGPNNTLVSIYKDPSSSDLVALNKAGLTDGVVRFIAVGYQKSIYCWDGNTALHAQVIDRLGGSLKLIKSGMSYRNDEIIKGVSKLEGGELHFISEENWSDTLKYLKQGKDLTGAFLMSPFKSKQEIIDAVPQMVKKFKFVESYITGFDGNGPLKQLQDFIQGN